MKNTNRKKQIISRIILLSANLIFFLTIWLLDKYDRICFDQFLYQIKSSSVGAHRVLTESAIVRVGLFGVVFTIIEILIYRFLSGNVKGKLRNCRQYIAYCRTKGCSFFQKSAMAIAVTLFVFSAGMFIVQLDVTAYVDTISTESDFIEEHYVDPKGTDLHFPKQKRNLIYIFLESMENTYADVSAGGPITTDYIPELTLLAEENISFSNTSDIGGAHSFNGTTWTAAAMVSQTSGVPVKVPLTADNYGGEDSYMPGVVSLGDILKEQGYRQMLLLGSDADFACRNSYFTEHGNYEILDIDALKAAGRLPEDYLEWWGFEDQKLFAFAKEELLKLAESGQPFNFTMLTADTHFPDGYLCPLCEETYEEQYANVLACSAKQVYEFISWIKDQSFYENTTIIISGDHLTMDPAFLDGIEEDYERTIYNCIINAPITPEQEKNRQFASFDMLPTTLAAMGVEIDGDRLGLGTNLFSEKETLTEKYGFEVLDKELQKKSVFYNTQILDE